MNRTTILTLTLTLTLSAMIAVPTARAEEDDANAEQAPRLEFSGYLQTRFTAAQGEDSTFLIRRNKLKAVYETEHTLYKLQINALPTGVGLNDGIIGLTEPWSGERIATLLIGQKKVPFGFEIPYSSSKRLFMERTTIVRRSFPKERDLGAMAEIEWSLLRVDLAVVNGQGLESLYLNADPTTFKNVVARAGIEHKGIRVGVSTYQGSSYYADPAGGPDPVLGDRVRYGADAGATFQVIPGLGDTMVLAEFIMATDIDTDSQGGYVGLGQELVGGFTVAARYQMYDPDADTDDDGQSIIDADLLYQITDHVRARIEGSFVMEEGTSVDNDGFTAELQLKF